MNRFGEGQLLGGLTLGSAIVFTLLPNSHSLMIIWPWVLLWQITILLPIAWLNWQLWHRSLTHFRLGGGLDGVMIILIIAIINATIASEFPQQSAWYSVAVLGSISGLYALYSFTDTPHRWEKLLNLHGLVTIVFIIESLGLWISQIYLPERERLRQIELNEGISLSFNFNNLDLQNWQPLGHQNYVAGYLILSLPILVGLSLLAKKKIHRWLWGVGVILGLLDLYTTSSRGGWIALSVAFLVGLLFSLGFVPRRLIIRIGFGILSLLIATIVSNDRLRLFFSALAQGDFGQSQLTYRWITNYTGWHMGLSHPWTGLGLGSVPILYQKYRPIWAGQEAELLYQLHSTPAQLWAELGYLGLLIPFLFIVLVLYRIYRWHEDHQNIFCQKERIIVGCLISGLSAYGVMSLTDYQLDNVAIMGSLIVNFVVLWRILFTHSIDPITHFSLHKIFSLITIALSIAFGLWLIPIHQAWSIAQDGFNALANNQIDRFVEKVSFAAGLTPWEAYYAEQLAWNLGELSFQTKDLAQAQYRRQEAIVWFEQAIKVSPYQEFNYSNLGWLQIQNANPVKAIEAFHQAIELVPAKEGLFLGLGISYLLNNQPELAIEALSQELLRHPSTIASPIWQNPPLDSIQSPLFDRLEQKCEALINQNLDLDFTTYAHQVRGGLRWWRGDEEGAKADWTIAENRLGLGIVYLSENPGVSFERFKEDNNAYFFDSGPPNVALWDYSTGKYLIRAWTDHDGMRSFWTDVTWEEAIENGLEISSLFPTKQALAEDFDQAKAQSLTFGEWLKDPRHYRVSRPERLGFGVLNRHLGGAVPVDYGRRIENLLLNEFFPSLFPERSFLPRLDDG